MAGDREFVLDGLGLDDVRAVLAPRFDVAPARTRRTDRTYLDTFDGRLHAAGLALAREPGRLVLLDAAGAELDAAVEARAPAVLFATHLPDGALRERVLPLCEPRALAPIVRVRARLAIAAVLDDAAKTVTRLVVETARVDGSDLPPRLRVLGVRGYDKALARVRRACERDLALPRAGEPLLDAAVRAAGGTPGGLSSRLDVRLARDERADAAAAAVLAALLDTVERNLPGVRDGTDTEFLHDMRVAVRRTRSVLRELAGVFPPEELARFRDGFRRLQRATGPVRDLDVLLLELPDQPELAPLRSLLRERRRAERRRMLAALRAPLTTELLDDWRALIEALGASPAGERPDAEAPIALVAGRRIRITYRRMVKAGALIDDATPAASLHELRKSGKELRYLLELFGAVFPPAAVKPMVAALKALQDTLGRHQDAEVQGEVLHAVSDAVATRTGGAAALMAMGSLDARLARAQRQARAEFAERFATFAAIERQSRVRKAFR